MRRKLPTAEAATAVGIDRMTLQRWIRLGKVKAPKPVLRNGRGVRLWTQADMERLRELLGQPVDIIELSVRASNCLKAAKIRTIGDLVSKTDEELIGYKNFGKKSLDEIKEKLKELGLSLGMQI